LPVRPRRRHLQPHPPGADPHRRPHLPQPQPQRRHEPTPSISIINQSLQKTLGNVRSVTEEKSAEHVNKCQQTPDDVGFIRAKFVNRLC
jgi:hypothetical protein